MQIIILWSCGSNRYRYVVPRDHRDAGFTEILCTDACKESSWRPVTSHENGERVRLQQALTMFAQYFCVGKSMPTLDDLAGCLTLVKNHLCIELGTLA